MNNVYTEINEKQMNEHREQMILVKGIFWSLLVTFIMVLFVGMPSLVLFVVWYSYVYFGYMVIAIIKEKILKKLKKDKTK